MVLIVLYQVSIFDWKVGQEIEWWAIFGSLYLDNETLTQKRFWCLSSYILRRPQFFANYVVTVKSTVEILQIFVAFSQYMNFKDVNTNSLKF
jgi:hypothetical protein